MLNITLALLNTNNSQRVALSSTSHHSTPLSLSAPYLQQPTGAQWHPIVA